MVIVRLVQCRTRPRFDRMMTLGSTGVGPLLPAAWALDEKQVAACIGTVCEVVMGSVTLMA